MLFLSSLILYGTGALYPVSQQSRSAQQHTANSEAADELLLCNWLLLSHDFSSYKGTTNSELCKRPGPQAICVAYYTGDQCTHAQVLY